MNEYLAGLLLFILPAGWFIAGKLITGSWVWSKPDD